MNLSHDHIPRLLESHSFRRESKDSTETDKTETEQYDSITELPSTSQQLQHLVKNRPRKAKTRAPTRSLLAEQASQSIGEGLEAFFRPGSATPSTLTPVVSPTSEDTSFLSFADSPTMSHVTSGETTPILDERKMKISRQSPVSQALLKNWTPRSRSTDNIEQSPSRKSPLVKYDTVDEPHSFISLDGRHLEDAAEFTKNKINNNGLCKTPVKPRPWSVVGGEVNKGSQSESAQTTPDELDKGNV